MGRLQMFNRLGDEKRASRILLVEANDMPKWIGGDIPYEVHIPPIGLMYLAAYARSMDPESEIRIVESSLQCRTDEEFVQILSDFQPDIVGIRSISFFLEEFQRIARLSRTCSNAHVLAGGPIVQAYKKDLFSHVPEIHVAVKGEGEQVFAALLTGQKLADIRGIYFRDAAGVVENPDAPAIADLDAIPIPAYDLLDLDLYRRQLSYAYNHRRQGVLVTSRGCAYDCTFCFKTASGFRLRSAQNVFAEIKHLYEKFDIRDFYIVDDIFNVSLKRSLSIFDMIIREGLKLRLYFANGLRADIVTREFVDSAIRAGAIWFTYAIESANEDIQKLVNKHIDLKKARSAIEYTQRQNVVVNIDTMYGFPTETRKMAQQTLDWLGNLPHPSLLPYHFCLRCFPGCRIRTQALEAGWEPDLLEWGNQLSYNDPPLGTPTLTKSEMFQIILEYHERFGLKNANALRRALRILRTVGYREEEIAHMYSVLMHKMITDAGQIV
jgi:anaerobic magnesium-protoporphyrin IX monomethyl ester cyclase